MNNDQIIYSISIEDILTVIEDNNLKLEIKKEDIPFIEDKIVILWETNGAMPLNMLY